MWAVTIVEGKLRWASRPDPVPGDNEIVVAVKAAGINAADLMQRQGFYPAPPGVPADIPGLEMAGEVVAVGSRVSRFVLGDRVMAVVGGGAQAEMAAVDERCALPVPAGLSWEEAGGFPEAFSTAHDALFTQCRLAMGERVLVTAAAGGVGTAGVQLAAVAGASVVASVRSAERHAGRAARWGRRPSARPTRRCCWGPSTSCSSWWGRRACPVCSEPWPWADGSWSSGSAAVGPGPRST